MRREGGGKRDGTLRPVCLTRTRGEVAIPSARRWITSQFLNGRELSASKGDSMTWEISAGLGAGEWVGRREHVELSSRAREARTQIAGMGDDWSLAALLKAFCSFSIGARAILERGAYMCCTDKGQQAETERSERASEI